jgi:hypothetical protein
MRKRLFLWFTLAVCLYELALVCVWHPFERARPRTATYHNPTLPCLPTPRTELRYGASRIQNLQLPSHLKRRLRAESLVHLVAGPDD